MRILIASKHTHLGRRPIGGVQTWNLTVGNEFGRRGHTVTYWEPGLPLPRGRYELGVFANLRCMPKAIKLCDRVKKVAHGVIPDERGAPEFYGVSEEVVERWGCGMGVLRQPIDVDFWRPSKQQKSQLLLRHSYRGGLPFLKPVADMADLDLASTVNKSALEVRTLIHKAAVVVATGRAALEAAACGVPVVIADDREYQGPLMAWDFESQMKVNYSGRGGIIPDEDSFALTMERAMEVGSLRDHVIRKHNPGVVVEELLE